MSTVQFTLNGQSVEAPAGKSIFNIAKDLGIAIPHLCHKEGLAPDGNCRACVVEIAGERLDRGERPLHRALDGHQAV